MTTYLIETPQIERIKNSFEWSDDRQHKYESRIQFNETIEGLREVCRCCQCAKQKSCQHSDSMAGFCNQGFFKE